MVSMKYFENIIDTLREPLLVLDGELRVAVANRAFLKTFNVEREEAVGVALYELEGGQWRIPELQRLIEGIIPNDAVIEDFEVSFGAAGSGVRTLALNARRLDAANEHGASILLAFEDITGARQVEAERQRLMDELSRSNTELERFAYVASHDLQEPLRMVSSYTQILARKYSDKLDEKGLQYMEYAVDGARRMQALINGLLDYSRIGTRGGEFETVDMDEVLRLVQRNMQLSLKQAGAVLTVDPLPAVHGDQQQLLQAFQNLLTNAVKFRGETAPVIHIGASRTDEQLVFSVRDNGIGIDPRYFEKMFIVFQRLHTRAEFPGHGIGLAITKRIVERHGGSIWAESEPGAGTTFFLTLDPARGET